ncbi:DHH family phosphoesterase [Williamsia maris]|uniref:Phosphoesterase RecJ domain-containing protein n=1 Tax=Williamsia maris TaxID=72806 RepID=A0ABT1HKT5_9NOCA|nr:DHH family phosphoesterase [Williamsia maris]MCP2178542.1 phosphoesterase RecJ domain-containing protein [Williamsia maris]
MSQAVAGPRAQVAQILREAQAVTVLCHVRPDADTIGSGLALALALDRAGVEVEVGFPGPWSLPDALGALPGAKLIVDPTELVGHRVAVAMDCASTSRLGDLAELIERADHGVVIDHHASNRGFGDVNVIDPSADCTAELVLELLDDLEMPIDSDIATCLFAGLVTDTGSFRWARAGAHEVAARLLETGVDGPAWTRLLLDTHQFGWLTMVSEALQSAVLVPEAFSGAGLVYALVGFECSKQIDWAEAESVIDLVRTVGDAEVAVVFKESEPGEWTVSMRSRSDVDLVPLARTQGGGGHRHAAGFSITGSATEVVEKLLASV